MKRRTLIFIIVLFLLWNVVTFLFLTFKSTSKDSKDVPHSHDKLFESLEELKEKAYHQSIVNDRLIRDVNKLLEKFKKKLNNEDGVTRVSPQRTSNMELPHRIIPILVMACDRPTVKTIIEKLFLLRPSTSFPIIVSQDCAHEPTSQVIQAYHDRITYIQQPDQSGFDLPQKQRHNQGYYKISRHYKWALTQVFDVFNHTAVVIVEDDLEISPDFFEYFRATYEVMLADSSLWCVSAWNDNGKEEFIDRPGGSDLLYRTDFFPGLGWMLFKGVWQELAPKWPLSYWDDWMRHPDQRKGRACIRPEIPRTSTFGKVGVSKGQYFEKHLKFIKHYTGHVPFTKYNLTYLIKENYDREFLKKVYDTPLLNFNYLDKMADIKVAASRLEYMTPSEFVVIAKKLSIMEDLKSDIPRTGYMGVVSVMYQGHRIYISPPSMATSPPRPAVQL